MLQGMQASLSYQKYMHDLHNYYFFIGTKSDHCKTGCKPCDLKQSCDINSGVSCQCKSCCIELNKFELNLREKALKNPAFPDQEVGSCW